MAKPARPLTVIESEITEELEGAYQIGLAYYRRIGELLTEARPQFKTPAKYQAWAEKITGRSLRMCQRYIQLSNVTDVVAKSAKTLSEAIGHPHPSERKAKAADDPPTITHETALAGERRQQKALMLKLIDVGYKGLALKLHPDTGGTSDEMMSLKAAKDTLMTYAERWV